MSNLHGVTGEQTSGARTTPRQNSATGAEEAFKSILLVDVFLILIVDSVSVVSTAYQFLSGSYLISRCLWGVS